MNQTTEFFLRRERRILINKLYRLDALNEIIGEYDAGSMNVVKRWILGIKMPTLRLERLQLDENKLEIESRISEIEFKLTEL